jgi:hypothetical protein
LDEKLLLLSKTAIDRVEVLPFTAELKQLTARQFMQQVLKEKLGVKVLLTGTTTASATTARKVSTTTSATDKNWALKCWSCRHSPPTPQRTTPETSVPRSSASC